MDLTKAIVLKGFPYYYVFFDERFEDIEGSSEKTRILENGKIVLFKPAMNGNPEISKELVPNENGKIAMKSEAGVPVPLLLAQVLEKVKEAVLSNKAEIGKRSHEEKPKSNLDPALVLERLNLRMEYDSLMQSAKNAKNFEKLQEIKPFALELEDKIRQFDIDHPGYNDKKKSKKRDRSDREERHIAFQRRILLPEEQLEWDDFLIKWNYIADEIEKLAIQQDSIDKTKLIDLRIPKLTLKTFL